MRLALCVLTYTGEPILSTNRIVYERVVVVVVVVVVV